MDAQEFEEDPLEFQREEICPFDDYNKDEAKERASILWLLSKAYDGAIPSELRVPFYRDHEHHRRLKPKIVHSLASAELYCLTLANIYSDPNYHNLDHHGIIQALMRKGICLVETRDAPLTETVLVQTAPLKLSAHMCVIEGIVSLYIKEVLIPDKVVDVVRSFSHVNVNSEMPSNPEEAAVLWINKCCVSLEQEIKSEWTAQEPMEKLPRIPVLQEISDISDGCSLAAVICFYCPNHLNWQDVCWNDPMSLGDSIYNIHLVRRFCCDNLPRHVDFLSLEDFLYIHPSIKDNILVFVAELLFSFVIWPANCVTRHSDRECHENVQLQHEGPVKSRSGSIPSHKTHQTVCSAIPNLRADSYGGSTSSLPELRTGGGTHVSKDSSEKPSSHKKSSLSNERLQMSPQLHRTNSSGVVNGFKSSNSSLLNSGDSDTRSPSATKPSLHPVPAEISLKAKELLQGGGKRLSTGLEEYYHSLASEDGPVRSGSLSNICESKAWTNAGNERPSVKSSASSQSSGICVSDLENKNLSKTSFAELSKDTDTRSRGINIIYMQHDRESSSDRKFFKSGFRNKKPEKRTTFAALPNTTTWQQQKALSSNSSQADSGHETPVDSGDSALNVQLANLRMKLEEKRRKIELEKKRMEVRWKRERQKVGKAAFLQAVSHGGGTDAGTPDSGTGKDDDDADAPAVPEKSFGNATGSPSLVRRMSIQDIAKDLDTVQKKWLEQKELLFDQKSRVGDSVEATAGESQAAEDFEASIEQLNSSLCDIQADISRITIQQEHVENLMQDSVEDATHFFLHGQPSDVSDLQSSPVKTYQWNKDSFKSPINSHHPADGLSRVSASPHRQPYHTQRSLPGNKTPAAAAAFNDFHLPASPVRKQELSVNLEELYSKVVKPDSRQKMSTADQYYSLPDQKADGNTRHLQSRYKSPTRTANVPCRQKSQEELPRQVQLVHPVQAKDQTASSKGQPAEAEQGFYVSFEGQPKKSTTKWQRPRVCVRKAQATQAKEAEDDNPSYGFVIGADLVHPDPETEVEMAKKKELIMNLSIKRRADHECRRAEKEQEYARLKEEDQRKKDYTEKKREEERQRRQAILEHYRQRKIQEELEKEGAKDVASNKSAGIGTTKSRSSVYSSKKKDNRICSDFTKPIAELRNHTALQKTKRASAKPRPKSAYVTSGVGDIGLSSVDGTVINKRNSQFIGAGKEIPEFDIDSLNSTGTSASLRERGHSPSTNGHAGPCQLSPTRYCGDGALHPLEGVGRSSDGASDTTSNSSNAAAAAAEYTGPKLFVKPTAKSNRGIIINAINTVLAGAVNAETKKKVLEEINKSESKHFLILFRDAGCQFRAIYSYNPDTEEVIKMFGIGPKSVTDKVMEKFYKYNSGGKCFSEVQTKHLTVTIDAFTIPNSLWAGKRVVAPRKEFF